MLLTLSGCATLFSLLDANAADRFNKELATLSEEDREFAKLAGVKEVKPFINPLVAIIADAWALSPLIIQAIHPNQETIPPFLSKISDSGVYVGSFTSLVCSAASIGSCLSHRSVKEKIDDYRSIAEHKKRQAEIEEETARLRKERFQQAVNEFRENPLRCPLTITKITIIQDEYNYMIRVTVQNDSPWPVVALKVRLSGWNAFGDRLWLGIASQDLIGLAQNISIPTFGTEDFVWETWENKITKVSADIIRVLHSNGKEWEKP